MTQRGFTIIELVTVILILGALSVFAIARFNPGTFESFGFREEVLSAARYAQKTAMASACPVQLRVDRTGDQVSLFYSQGGGASTCGDGTNFNEPVSHPARGGAFVVQAPDSVDITGGGTVNVVFDNFGTPGNGLVIALDPGPDITIEAVTGYAHE